MASTEDKVEISCRQILLLKNLTYNDPVTSKFIPTKMINSISLDSEVILAPTRAEVAAGSPLGQGGKWIQSVAVSLFLLKGV